MYIACTTIFLPSKTMNADFCDPAESDKLSDPLPSVISLSLLGHVSQ